MIFNKSYRLQVAFSHLACPPLPEVLTTVGEFVADEAGADAVDGVYQLAVEPLSCFVPIGEDVEYRPLLGFQGGEKLHILGFEEGGTWNGDGFPS